MAGGLYSDFSLSNVYHCAKVVWNGVNDNPDRMASLEEVWKVVKEQEEKFVGNHNTAAKPSALLPLIRALGYGDIVTDASTHGKFPLPKWCDGLAFGEGVGRLFVLQGSGTAVKSDKDGWGNIDVANRNPKVLKFAFQVLQLVVTKREGVLDLKLTKGQKKRERKKRAKLSRRKDKEKAKEEKAKRLAKEAAERERSERMMADAGATAEESRKEAMKAVTAGMCFVCACVFVLCSHTVVGAGAGDDWEAQAERERRHRERVAAKKKGKKTKKEEEKIMDGLEDATDRLTEWVGTERSALNCRVFDTMVFFGRVVEPLSKNPTDQAVYDHLLQTCWNIGWNHAKESLPAENPSHLVLFSALFKPLMSVLRPSPIQRILSSTSGEDAFISMSLEICNAYLASAAKDFRIGPEICRHLWKEGVLPTDSDISCFCYAAWLGVRSRIAFCGYTTMSVRAKSHLLAIEEDVAEAGQIVR
jgi:hypothetical protein